MKKNIAIVAGGYSSEYVISISSADQIEKALDKEKYNVFTIIVNDSGWHLKSDTSSKIEVNKHDFSFSLNNHKTKFDCALIIIHGTPGEDGKLQGYFDTLRIPYTTSSTLASAITFNKVFSKNYVKPFDISLAKFISIKKNDTIDADKIIKMK